MKKLFLISFFLFSFCSLFAGGGKESIPDVHFNGKIQSNHLTLYAANPSNTLETFCYYDFGLIEKTTQYTDNRIVKKLFYNPYYNTKLSSKIKQNLFINVMINPENYNFQENSVIITNNLEKTEILFDSETYNLTKITTINLKNNKTETLNFEYNSENLLDTIYFITENYTSIKLKCFYDGILQEIPKPYFSHLENQNIFYKNIEELYIFSENNKILPKYNVAIIKKPGDAKEPETLEEIENQVMQRIYSYDSFGNISKIYEDLSGNWIYSIETELDENNNWLTKKIYRKKTDGSVILYYDYCRKINYFDN